MSGYVYIARRADGRIKIGSTKDACRRMAQLERQIGQAMTLVAETSG